MKRRGILLCSPDVPARRMASIFLLRIAVAHYVSTCARCDENINEIFIAFNSIGAGAAVDDSSWRHYGEKASRWHSLPFFAGITTFIRLQSSRQPEIGGNLSWRASTRGCAKHYLDRMRAIIWLKMLA